MVFFKVKCLLYSTMTNPFMLYITMKEGVDCFHIFTLCFEENKATFPLVCNF